MDKILIVEDSPTQASKLQYLLETNSYQVKTASDGQEGLHAAKSFLPDLILSDIEMPNMDGYRLCQRIKNDPKLKSIPVILLTALSTPEDVVNGLRAEADRYLTKPWNEEYLLDTVASVLEKRTYWVEKTDDGAIDVKIGDKKYAINASREEILSLFLSTYENAIHQNHQLTHSQRALSKLNKELERRVKDRTMELRKKNKELEAEIAERRSKEKKSPREQKTI